MCFHLFKLEKVDGVCGCVFVFAFVFVSVFACLCVCVSVCAYDLPALELYEKSELSSPRGRYRAGY